MRPLTKNVQLSWFRSPTKGTSHKQTAGQILQLINWIRLGADSVKSKRNPIFLIIWQFQILCEFVEMAVSQDESLFIYFKKCESKHEWGRKQIMSEGEKMSQKLPILNLNHDPNTFWSPAIWQVLKVDI